MSTVKELIEQLSKLNPDLPVYYDDASYGMSEIHIAEATEIYAHEIGEQFAASRRLAIVQLH